METTIIKLGGVSDSSMVVRSATFEEAFGDYSEARGKGRARRQERRLDRQEKKAERKVARQTTKQAKIGAKQATRQLRRGGRQEARIGRRATRKDLRQAMRTEQQADRMGRRGARLDMRQQREDARQMREDTRVQGDEGRENYMAEQELYRQGLEDQGQESEGGFAPEQGGSMPSEDWGSAPQGGGGYAEEGGGYAPQGGGGYAEEGGGSAPQGGGGYAPQGGGGYAPQGGGGYAEQDNYGDEDSGEGAYGDDNTYEGDYIQEEDEFNDDSYFNVEGMDGKAVVSPYVKETSQKLKNNAKAYGVLKSKRANALANQERTEGLDNLLNRARTRIVELKSNLDNYCNADGNPNEQRRRRKEVNIALNRRLRKRNRVGQYAGSEVPVESDLNPEFGSNRIEVPSSSNFDAYSDLGRPVIVNGTTMSDKGDYTDDIMGDFEPTTIEMQSSFDGSSTNKKTLMSIAIGVGVGALALYLAKRKGWI
jgi:hypothetical protein